MISRTLQVSATVAAAVALTQKVAMGSLIVGMPIIQGGAGVTGLVASPMSLLSFIFG